MRQAQQSVRFPQGHFVLECVISMENSGTQIIADIPNHTNLHLKRQNTTFLCIQFPPPILSPLHSTHGSLSGGKSCLREQRQVLPLMPSHERGKTCPVLPHARNTCLRSRRQVLPLVPSLEARLVFPGPLSLFLGKERRQDRACDEFEREARLALCCVPQATLAFALVPWRVPSLREVCIYACLYVYVCNYTYVLMFICICIQLYICFHEQIHTYIYICIIYTRRCICINTHTYMYMYLCMYTYLHIYTVIHIYIYTYVHMYIYMLYIYTCINIYVYKYIRPYTKTKPHK